MQISAKKGVKLFRDFYIDMDIKPYFIPQTVKIPIGFVSDEIQYQKNIGDSVKKFEIIALINNDIPVYSSVNGKILDFCTVSITNSFFDMIFVTIETDGSDTPTYPLWECKDTYTKEELLKIIKNAGIINESLKGYFVDFINLSTKYTKIIIDSVDEQPYDLSKTGVFLDYKKEVLSGAKILAKVFNIPRIELLIMKNFRTMELFKNGLEDIDIIEVKGKYPAEPEIVQYAHKNTALRVGTNCCRAVYRAAFFGEPQITSIVTVWGEGVKEPANYEILNGTLAKYLLEKCNAESELDKVVTGGLMNGCVALPELPILRWNGTLTALPIKKHNSVSYCVNCGRCVNVCPMKLAPFSILRSSNKKSEKIAMQLTAGMCVFCGVCSYICPSRQPLMEKIREYNKSLYRGREE